MKNSTLIQLEKPAKTKVSGDLLKSDPEISLIAEIAAESPDPIPPDVLHEISTSEQLVTGLEDMGVDNILDNIRTYSGHVEDFAITASTASARSIVCAWTCGKLLVEAKKKLGHGKFGKWRDKHLSNLNERTAQRYMSLAENCEDVRALLVPGAGLRQAYLACGVLQEKVKVDAQPDGDESPKAHALLSGLSGLQKKLRLFEGSSEKLAPGDLTQLKALRIELNRFFDKIIPNEQ